MLLLMTMVRVMMSGLLHVGDIIKEINGQEVLTPEQLQDLMKKYSGTITFKIIPTSQDQNSSVKVSFFHSLVLSLAWLRGSVVKRRSLAGVLSLSCARPVADG